MDASRPLSIQEISDLALKFDFNENIPLRTWARTAQTVSNEAKIYLAEGNLPKAYMLFVRYSTLYMDHMSKHPDSKSPEGKRILNSGLPEVDLVLSQLERIKPILQRDCEDWEASAARKREEREREQANRSTSKSTRSEKRASKDPAISSSKSDLLDAGENQELAVNLAQKEIVRRDADRRAIRKAGITPEQEQHRRIAGFWDHWDSIQRDQGDGFPDQEVTRASGSTYNYPRISKSSPVQYDAQLIEKRNESTDVLPPQLPSKDVVSRRETAVLVPPQIPSKEPILALGPPGPRSPKELSPARLRREDVEPPVPPPKPRRLTFRPAAYLENGDPLRSVFVPDRLREEFLQIAAENTRLGVEMCGILCGTAVNNALFVRCLLIPEQKCTSDTCETENEGAMFDYCVSEDLLILGWIHTHPTQTCFMSSRDLHTQSGYQVMLPESIAIVCAPRFEPSFGIFRLTNPPGLPHVLQCTQSATFHQHSVDNLYTSAGAPPPEGHVYVSDKLDFYVHDLRPSARRKFI